MPAIELLVQDPNVSTAMYLLYHTAANPADILLAFRVGECIYKMVLLLLLARPVFILMRSIRKNNVFFLKRRLWMFSIGMLLANSIFFAFFYWALAAFRSQRSSKLVSGFFSRWMA